MKKDNFVMGVFIVLYGILLGYSVFGGQIDFYVPPMLIDIAALVFYFLGLVFLVRHADVKEKRWMKLMIILFFARFPGFVLKLLHWYGADLLLKAGTLLFIAGFIPLMIYYIKSFIQSERFPVQFVMKFLLTVSILTPWFIDLVSKREDLNFFFPAFLFLWFAIIYEVFFKKPDHLVSNDTGNEVS